MKHTGIKFKLINFIFPDDFRVVFFSKAFKFLTFLFVKVDIEVIN